MKDLSSVGNTASAPKEKTGLKGGEVFDRRISMREADNGGFIVDASCHRQRAGNQRGQSMPEYCPDRQYVFTDFDSAAAKVKALFAMAKDAVLPEGEGGEGDDDE